MFLPNLKIPRVTQFLKGAVSVQISDVKDIDANQSGDQMILKDGTLHQQEVLTMSLTSGLDLHEVAESLSTPIKERDLSSEACDCSHHGQCWLFRIICGSDLILLLETNDMKISMIAALLDGYEPHFL